MLLVLWSISMSWIIFPEWISHIFLNCLFLLIKSCFYLLDYTNVVYLILNGTMWYKTGTIIMAISDDDSGKFCAKLRSDYKFGVRTLTVMAANIETLPSLDNELEVIVSSDDNYLTHGGGVSASIWEAAGPMLEEYVNHNRIVLRLADVWPTTAGNLKLKAIYHAISIDFDTNKILSAESARELYGKILDLAGNSSIKTVALPLLGAGAGGMEVDVSGTALAEALHTRSSITTATEHVYLACIPENFKSICQIMERNQIEPVGPAIIKASHFLPEEQHRQILELWNLLTNPDDNNNVLYSVTMLGKLIDGLITIASLKSQLPWMDKSAKNVCIRELPQGKEIAGNLEQSSMSSKLALAIDLLKIINQPMKISAANLCKSAVEARNRLVHGGHSSNIESLSIVLDASMAIANHIIVIANSNMDYIFPKLSIGQSFFSVCSVPTNLSKGFLKGSAVGTVAGGLLGPVGMVIGGLVGGLAGTYKNSSKSINNSNMPEPEVSTGDEPSVNTISQTNFTDVDESELNRVAFPAMVSGSALNKHSFGMTEPVRKMQQLLIEYMDADSKKELVDELGRKGYIGDDDLRILEYCVSDPDPCEILVNHLGNKTIRKILNELGYNTSGTTRIDDLARKLFEHLGFPINVDHKGIHTILAEIKHSKSRLVSVTDIGHLSGIVTQAATGIEYLLQTFIRFLSKALFDEAPEPYLQRNGLLEKSWRLDQCSLGKLIEILAAFRKDIDKKNNLRAKVLMPKICERPLLPENSSKLSNLRNNFAHSKDNIRGGSLDDNLQLAKEFFEYAEKLLEYIYEPEYRVFPCVIKICGVKIDKWGRRRTEATADDGTHESIFTDEILEPGAVYLMHPRTNPMRVDPILVPAGTCVARIKNSNLKI
jgi:O-acetyl-ADP-ribose deacetylase (regulator of RNase III)